MISFPKRERAQRAAACVGVDAGKFSHTLVVRPKGQADSKPFSFKTTRAGFDDAARFVSGQAGDPAPADVLVGIEFAGNYGFTFAHYLAALGFPIVSILPAHTKRWKDVAHNQPFKTDAKDAGTITDLLAQGHFATFPFLEPAYADLRYLVTARERLAWLRRGALTQLRTLLQVVFPEFEEIFPYFTKKTPLVLLRAYPAPLDLLTAPRARVLRLLKTTSRGQLGAQVRLRHEILLTLDRLALFECQMRVLEDEMVEALKGSARGALSPHRAQSGSAHRGRVPRLDRRPASVRSRRADPESRRTLSRGTLERDRSGLEAHLEAGAAPLAGGGLYVRRAEYQQARAVPGGVRSAVRP